ncbi:hypothetical protein MJA45_02580 [Paenibacillus aurantius]|uniref:Uncharacterized protein n=1 Tax=Paenibacillus aurantius TaxID=2918900 RepID=A0AA96RE22_9BACL|nr:hypothetical protein [Paenibacillus aurantius]WNQ11965.1 hypothetical protein MJA45_02580 [Paenibacillus aurantius]
MRLIQLELYKILAQKVVYLAFVVMVMLYGLFLYGQGESRGERIQALRDTFEQYGGELTKEKEAWADKAWAEYEQAEKAARAKEQSLYDLDSPLWARGWVGNDIKKAVQWGEEQERVTQQLEAMAVGETEGAPGYERKLAEKELAVRRSAGSPDYIFYQEGWRNILMYGQEIGYYFAGALTILGLSGTFSREYTSRMDSLLFSSRYGRTRALGAKLSAAAIYCGMIVGALGGVVLAMNGWLYGLTGWNTRLVNVQDLFHGTAFGGPIWLYFLKQLVYVWLGYTVLGMFVLLISSRTRFLLLPAFLGGLVFLLPAVWQVLSLPISRLNGVVSVLFPYLGFLKLEGLDRIAFVSILGRPVLDGDVLLLRMLAYALVLGLLLYTSIQRRQVS